MLIIPFSTDGVRNYMLFLENVGEISKFGTFQSIFGIILRVMVSENVKYGGVRVIPRISSRKLHNLSNLAIEALSENYITN